MRACMVLFKATSPNRLEAGEGARAGGGLKKHAFFGARSTQTTRVYRTFDLYQRSDL